MAALAVQRSRKHARQIVVTFERGAHARFDWLRRALMQQRHVKPPWSQVDRVHPPVHRAAKRFRYVYHQHRAVEREFIWLKHGWSLVVWRGAHVRAGAPAPPTCHPSPRLSLLLQRPAKPLSDPHPPPASTNVH
jgi:hypothetical protein